MLRGSVLPAFGRLGEQAGHYSSVPQSSSVVSDSVVVQFQALLPVRLFLVWQAAVD